MDRGVKTSLGVAALLGALAIAPFAVAQTAPAPAPARSVYSFQSDSLTGYGDGLSILSGTAIFTASTAATYRVDMVSIQYTRSATGEETRVLARQLCSATPDEDSITIACQLVEADSPTYAPDNFRISQNGDSAVWNGVLTDGGEAVVFVRVQ